MSQNDLPDDAAFSDVSTEASLPSDWLKNPESTQTTSRGWTDTWLHTTYDRRVRREGDLVIGIVAENADRNVGKTTLAADLAFKMDRTMTGFTADKIAFDDKEFANLLDLNDGVEYGSAVLADEIHKWADSRKAASNVNTNISQAIAMARFRQAYVIYTLPSFGMVDKRIKQMTDVLIKCHSEPKVGTATVYEVFLNDFDTEKVKTRGKETITWEPLDGHPVYEELEEMKATSFQELIESHLESDEDDGEDEREVTRDEAKKMARELYRQNYSYSEILDELPESPYSDDGSWSKSTLSDWLSDVEKGSNVQED